MKLPAVRILNVANLGINCNHYFRMNSILDHKNTNAGLVCFTRTFTGGVIFTAIFVQVCIIVTCVMYVWSAKHLKVEQKSLVKNQFIWLALINTLIVINSRILNLDLLLFIQEPDAEITPEGFIWKTSLQVYTTITDGYCIHHCIDICLQSMFYTEPTRR